MQTQLAHVKLSEIAVSTTNHMFRETTDLEQNSLQELIDSIREKGVIQPVLLRPQAKNGANVYELICGERRYRASLAVQTAYKSRDTIPAYIRVMSDEEALDLQLTENLQRKDVHPLKEARAYQFLFQKDAVKNCVAELALRFGKSETYILQRMKLNDLLPEIVKDYEAGKMTLGHALLIARLTPEDQKEVKQQCKQNTYNKGKSESYYEHVYELQSFIDRSITKTLSAAPFNKEDATLLPKAGACTTCSKRSGANQLFTDIKEKDRCFDGACFQLKNDLFLIAKLKHNIVEKPDILYLKDKRSKLTPAIEKFLKEEKVKTLEEYTDFKTSNHSGGAKLVGMWVNGDKAGHMATVYSTKTKGDTKGPKGTSQSTMELVSAIKERTTRAAELDEEKVYTKVLEAFDIEKNEAFKKNSQFKICAIDELLVRFVIWDQCKHHFEIEFEKMFKIPEEDYHGKNAEKVIKALEQLSKEDFVIMLRMAMRDKYAGQATSIHRIEGKLITRMAKAFGVDVSAFEKEQMAQREKREARAKERIKVLQKESKPKKVKGDTKGPKASKPEKKKSKKKTAVAA